MALRPLQLFQEIRTSVPLIVQPFFWGVTYLVFICALACVQFEVNCANTRIKRDNLDSNTLKSSPTDALSSWLNCPQGWTLIYNKCYKLTDAPLIWQQAQVVCSSHGGNLASINSLSDLILINEFVSTFQENGIWIGLVRMENQSYQWAGGLPAVEFDGLWSANGLKMAYEEPSAKLCSYMKSASPESRKLRWELTVCDELHMSLCMVEPCEQHAMRCADGSKCVSKVWMCDNHWDCDDGSDEFNCNYGLSTSVLPYSQHCGATLKGVKGTLQSPNYPDNYPAFANCVWKIEVLPPKVIELKLGSLDIENLYDWLDVYDGIEMTDDTLVEHFDERLSEMTVISTGSFVYIHFVSDYSVEAKGFNITWKSVDYDTLSCGGHLKASASEKYLHFPSSNSKVLRQKTCDWLISASEREILHIQFSPSLLLSGKDSITIFDGPNLKFPTITYINSTTVLAPRESLLSSDVALSQYINIPPVIVSSGHHLYIHISIGSGSRGPFLSYKDGCEVFIASNSSFILSPGFMTSQYTNNLKCTWTVPKHNMGKNQTLIFLPGFHTEFNKDFVQVQTPTSILNLSGSSFLPPSGISSNYEFFISFHSDSTVNRGRWAAVISYDCDPLPEIPPLMVDTSKSNFGTIVQFSCPPEFKLMGSTSAVCGIKGSWHVDELPKCEKINCGPLPVPPEMYLTEMTGTIIGSTAKYKCFHGYRMIGSDTAICSYNGWENVPSCEGITCPKEPPPRWGTGLAEEITFGYMRMYLCNDGFQMIGVQYSHCNLTSQWSDPVPVCQALSCPKLFNISHGYFNVTGEPVLVGDSVQIICDKGYQANGWDMLTCLPSLLYDRPLSVCIDVDECSDDKSICGNHLCQNLQGDYSCFCSKGYQQPSGTRHECVDVNECEDNNGECSDLCTNTEGGFYCSCPSDSMLYTGPWHQMGQQILVPYKTCLASCVPLRLTNQAAVFYNQRNLFNGNFLNGTEAYIKCPSGYTPSSTTITCLSGTGWSAPLPTCNLSKCEKLRDISNGSVVYSSLTLGSKAIYSCNEGFVMQKMNVRFCMEYLNESLPSKRFRWSGAEPSCIYVTCPKLEPPLNGTVNVTTITYNSVALFRCYCGYRLMGQSVLRCRADGQWSAPSPTCAVQSCMISEILTNATILQYSSNSPLGSTVHFQCDAPGYNLSGYHSLVCLPISISKKSMLQPTMKLSVIIELEILNNSSLLSACMTSYTEKMRAVIKDRLKNLIVNAFNQNVKVILHSDSGNFYDLILKIDVIISSPNVSATHYHGHLIWETINSSLIEDFDREFADEPISCPPLSVKPNSGLSTVGRYECQPGLRLLEDLNGDKNVPVCIEDCIADGSLTVLETSTDMPDNLLVTGAGVGLSGIPTRKSDVTSPHTSAIQESSTTRVFTATPTRATTDHITSTVATTIISTAHPPSPIAHQPSPTVHQPSPTAHQPSPTANQPSPKSTEFKDSSKETEAGNILKFPKLEGPDAEFFGRTSVTDKLWREDMTSSSAQSTFGNEQLQDNSSNLTNISCTSVGLKLSSENRTEGPSAPLVDMDINRSKNVSECSTTHTLEKQEVTMVHHPSSSHLNFTSPMYSVELTDGMMGGFSNVSCIDAVHVSINTKVNELLREFGNKMGKQVCVYAPDAYLELTAGNITFKGLKARTYVKFSFGYVTSIKPSVESCAIEFKEYTYEELPKKFERVQLEVVDLGCELDNYTSNEFKLSLTGWLCHSGYVMDLNMLQCIYKTSDQISPVMTVPRLALPFTANLTFHQTPSAVEAHCRNEYTEGLKRVLSVQPGLSQCPGVNITLTNSVIVKLLANAVSATIMVHLLPMQEGISKSVMQACGRFISTEFQKLASLSLTRETLPRCPLIKMAQNGLQSSEKTQFFCPPAYLYDKFNFICIDSYLSFYATNTCMILQGAIEGGMCDNAIKDSAEQMANTVNMGLQSSLTSEVCNGTKGVYILHEQGTVSIEKQKNQILVYMPITLISLHGNKLDCENCAEQLFLYLGSALPQPSNSMAKNISDHCRSEVSNPGEFTVLTKQWKCIHEYSYDPLSHKCEQQAPLPTDEGLSLGQSMLHRHKRDAMPSVRWQRDVPYCIDVQPPRFKNCPNEPIIVILNSFIKNPWNIPKPTATDNSGQEPTIYLTPSDFVWPSSFRQVQTVTMTAEDASGNKVICNITVKIVDEVPPKLECPSPQKLVVETSEMLTELKYNNTQFSFEDNHSNVTLLFDPPENTVVPVISTFIASIQAVDASNNSRTCHFDVKIEPLGCPDWSLHTPVGVTKACVKAGHNSEGLICNMTCLSNGVSEKAACSTNATWNITALECPITAILGDCPSGSFKVSSGCKECNKGTYQNGSDPSMCTSCAAGFSTITTGAKYKHECFALCEINKYSHTGLQPCTSCPIGYYQEKQGSTSCEPCIYGNSKYCPDQCKPGHYSSNGLVPCWPCPHNYYNAVHNSTTCQPCPSNKITLSVGSSRLSECMVPADPCQGNPCKNLGTCVPNGRNFTCDCKQGFSGPSCQNKNDPCNCFKDWTCLNQGNRFQCKCQPDTCGINGHCENTTSGFQCLCNNGFKGERCDIFDAPPCQCENGGNCLDGFIQYCLCPNGFSGTYCEMNIDECTNNPCLNGATCQDGINHFNCSCPYGFTGTFCEENIDDCTSSPCQNDGFCQDEVGTFSCQCPFGYSGVSCEIELNLCDSEPCLNGGECPGSQEMLNCECSTGFTGNRCETKIDNCEPMPCHIMGTESCKEEGLTFHCNCLPGWKGQVCNVSVYACESKHESKQCNNEATYVQNKILADLCSSNPCQNSGSCNSMGDAFVCNCQNGFTGATCEINIDECSAHPCKNNGLCKDGVNTFFCQCPVGFAGELCEVDIDECMGLPCQNNGTCIPATGSHQCICRQGFTGKHCEIDINECQFNPCLNGGKCSDQISTFVCSCLNGFTGTLCENSLDDCWNRSRCLNGASCKRVNTKDVCTCTPYYTGSNCGKEKSSNFSLYFHGNSYASSQPPLLSVANFSELSICLWSKVHSESTYLSLRSGDEIILALRQAEAMPSLFMNVSVILPTNDGLWHHMCWGWNETVWTVYFDGVLTQIGDLNNTLIGDSFELRLGQQISSDEEWFKGHLNSVNIYSMAMTHDRVLSLSSSCQQTQRGDVFDWVLASTYLIGDVEIVTPSQCEQTVCSASLCGLTTNGADKIPPTAISCPVSQFMTSDKILTPVTWDEPVFTDNVGVTTVIQNFRSGHYFSYGHHVVAYFAFDSNNNSAQCSFDIFLRRFDCIDPPPPVSGSRVCGDWKYGRYCVPSCMNKYQFVTQVPKFYRCGQEGIWDPPNAFPACASYRNPNYSIVGSVIFKGPSCSENFKHNLHDKLVQVLNQVEACISVCHHTQNLPIFCSNDVMFRKKRSFEEVQAEYNVTLAVNLLPELNQYQSMISLTTIPDEIVQSIKNNVESQFTLTSVDLHLLPLCETGQTLQDKTCVDCPTGHYVTREQLCKPCPRGSYNKKPLQTVCLKCPEGKTTQNDGAISSSQCANVCNMGSYFNIETSVCVQCPLAHYQDKEGEWECTPCPSGLTTDSVGAKSVKDCKALCGIGREVGVDGKCRACLIGTFRSSSDIGLYCTPCLAGWTTQEEGSVSESQCNVAKCLKGYYKYIVDGTCHPCPIGTFQPNAEETTCLPCGINLTTEKEAAYSKMLCIPGKVNECELKIANCDINEICKDQDNGYSCECKLGVTAGKCIDVCEHFCNKTTKSCNNKEEYPDCYCRVELCKGKETDDQQTQTLLIASMSLTTLALIILFIVIAVCIHRKNRFLKEKKRIRIYREEIERAAFTNAAFDSFPTGTSVTGSEIPLYYVPMRMATRWHNHYFVSDNSSSEIESTDF